MRRRALMALALVVTFAWSLAACTSVAGEAPPPSREATAEPTQTSPPQPPPPPEASTPAPEAVTAPPETDQAPDASDDIEDPAQQTRRSGPIAEFGGPPFGDQGSESLGEGQWCSTVALFWGGEPPQNASFTIDGVQSSPSGALSAEGAVCGSRGAEVPCVGFTMTPETSSVFCSMILIAGPAFEGEAQVTFVGTLECTEPQYCDAAIAREAQPGPPIVISSD
ncbi:hypothetical protein AB1K54_11100 [Microbacterium sp. BWT-B31]|uniref:hypothetical protein n=1 Tax=Microbacterium sp. BWT-B31 TaxID=3232072 RepID=UPI00352917B9